MKFTYFAISATFIVCAAAAATTTSAPVPTHTPTVQEKCLTGCTSKQGVEFSNCQAECLGNPHPSQEQVNQNTKCVADCDQGDGSAAETKKYSDCVAGCGTKYFMPVSDTTQDQPTTDKPTATGGSPQASVTPSGTGSGSGSGSGNGSTTSSATAKPSTASASSVMVSISFAGTIAAIAALFSL